MPARRSAVFTRTPPPLFSPPLIHADRALWSTNGSRSREITECDAAATFGPKEDSRQCHQRHNPEYAASRCCLKTGKMQVANRDTRPSPQRNRRPANRSPRFLTRSDIAHMKRARWQTVNVPQCRICIAISHGNAVLQPISPQRTTPHAAKAACEEPRAPNRRNSFLLRAK